MFSPKLDTSIFLMKYKFYLKWTFVVPVFLWTLMSKLKMILIWCNSSWAIQLLRGYHYNHFHWSSSKGSRIFFFIVNTHVCLPYFTFEPYLPLILRLKMRKLFWYLAKIIACGAWSCIKRKYHLWSFINFLFIFYHPFSAWKLSQWWEDSSNSDPPLSPFPILFSLAQTWRKLIKFYEESFKFAYYQ